MKILYILIGSILLTLGVLGTILPILPTFPFLLGSAYFYARSSRRLHTWLINTKMYKEMVIPLVDEKQMTFKNKMRIMSIVTLLMTIGFICMGHVPLGRFVLCFVWIFHMYYFLIKIKTKQIV